MTPTFFPNQEEFRKWLTLNHQTEKELVVGFYKVNTQKPTMSWSESVDQALCFGWIDGVRKSIDAESYSIRFTPRKKNSIWSVINIQKIDVLSKAGSMTEAGQKAYALRTAERSAIYSHEKEAAVLDDAFEQQFRTNEAAWIFFNKQAPSYQKVMIHWITSAKQEKTRISRLTKLITVSENQKRMS